MIHLIVFSLNLLITSGSSGDISYFDTSNLHFSDYRRNIEIPENRRYIDVYTNNPKEISKNHFDELESEYGVFVAEENNKNKRLPQQCSDYSNCFSNSDFIGSFKYQENKRKPDDIRGFSDYKRRPKFRTSKFKTKNDLLNNVQKIPVQKKLNNKKLTKRRGNFKRNHINDIFNKYMHKLNTRKRINRTKIEDSRSKFFDEQLTTIKNKTIKIANKFLSLFTIVQFPNSKCQATSASSDYEGTCFHQSECDQRNGTAIGNCANGYGVCCVFKFTCGDSSSQNCSYFESPGYPNYNPPDGSIVPPTISPTVLPTTTTTEESTPDPRLKNVFYMHHQFKRESRQQGDSVTTSLRCVFMVFKNSDSVQQMRIDFIDLELKGPTNGNCVEERLIISGQNINDPVPVICGYSTGQHVYVDVANLQGPLQLAVLANTVERKRYKIRICQLSSSCAGNMNCLQYYTGTTGTISTFNYDQSAIQNRSSPGYFNNLNYAICIRREAGYCTITYSNVMNGIEYPFQLVNVDDTGESIIPPGQAGAEIFNCPDDYIIVDGIRLCGDKLNDGSINADFTMNAPVTDTSGGPIIIPVRTDGSVTGRGFKLFYMQNRCPLV